MNGQSFHVESRFVEQTQKHLRAKGAIGHEGVVLWCGTHDPPQICGVIIPIQDTGAGRFSVPRTERQRIARALLGSGQMIVAQVHSHPSAAFHSPADDADAIPRRVGSYSLVIPDYGARRDLLDGAALFERTEDHRWQEVATTVFILNRKPGFLRWLIDNLRNAARSHT